MSRENNQSRTANPGKNDRVAFKDVSNRSNIDRPKHSKAAKPQKGNASNAYSRLSKVKLADDQSTVVKIKSTHGANTSNAFSRLSEVKLADGRSTAVQIRSTHGPVLKKSLHEAKSGDSNKPSYQDGRANNIDERDAEKPCCVTAYVQDIYKHFKEEEHRAVVGHYMKDQEYINERMRSILVDWLCSVHHQMKGDPETIFLTVNIIDRYLSENMATRANLQLIGTSAFLIASKYEQIWPAELRDLVYVTDKTFTKDEILGMEETILKALDYRISIPTVYKFFVRYLNAGHADKKLIFLGAYILEESLLSYHLSVAYKPSQLAAAAILIGRHAIGREKWSPTLLKYSGYREEDIIPIAKDMMAAKKTLPPGLNALSKKYSRASKLGAASIALPSDL